ncbi:MAG TPA: YbaB/EbfC family nucleoid-associated protein [Streptosporangiaceae bacterium]|jgi:DNA-binding protein YbaB
MGDESNRLAGLLNASTPANPGKPTPWLPGPATNPAPTPPAPEGVAESEPAASGEVADPPDEAPVAELPPWDPAAISEVFSRTIAAAERQQAQLQQALAEAKERTYEAESADGEVRVTVDGRPRITAVHIDPRALRGGGDELGQAIADTTNAAVRAALDGTKETLLSGLDPALRTAVEGGIAETGRAIGDDAERR